MNHREWLLDYARGNVPFTEENRRHYARVERVALQIVGLAALEGRLWSRSIRYRLEPEDRVIMGRALTMAVAYGWIEKKVWNRNVYYALRK